MQTSTSKADLTPVFVRAHEIAQRIADRLQAREPRAVLIPVKAYHGHWRVERRPIGR